jgi:hypothetical protein
VPEDPVRFVLGDVFEELDKLEPYTFETVFCFGFFYHTLNHMLLLSKIARLKPKHVILDTRIYQGPATFVLLHSESIAVEGAGAVPVLGEPTRVVVGYPPNPVSS